MPDKQRLSEGRNINDRRASIINKSVVPTKPLDSTLSVIANTLNLVAPAVQNIASTKIRQKAVSEVQDASNVAADIQAEYSQPGESLDDTMSRWQKAVNTDPRLLSLNPFAQAKARKDIARASARAMQPEISDLVNNIKSNISGDEDFVIMDAAISQLRQEKLANLGITDANEIAAFNNEFNVMKQNFTAQFNAKLSNLKKEAGFQDLSNRIDIALSDSFDLFGNDRGVAQAASIGESWSAEIAESTGAGILSRAERNGVVKQNIMTSMLRDNLKNGGGIQLIEDGLLKNTVLSIDNGATFDMDSIDNGRFRDELIARLSRQDAIKLQENARSDKETKDSTRANAREAFRKAVSETFPGSREAELEKVRDEFANDDMIKLMGPDWISVLDKMQISESTAFTKIGTQDFKAGQRSPEFTKNWKERLENQDDDFSTWLELADVEAGNGTITYAERALIQDEYDFRIGAVNKSTVTPFKKEMTDNLDALMSGTDYRKPKDMQNFIAGNISFDDSSKQISDSLASMNNDIRRIITKEYIKLSKSTDVNERNGIRDGIKNIINDLANSQFGALKEPLTDKARTKLITDPAFDQQVFSQLNVDDQLDVAKGRASVEQLQALLPTVDPDTINSISKTINNFIKNNPGKVVNPALYTNTASTLKPIFDSITRFRNSRFEQGPTTSEQQNRFVTEKIAASQEIINQLNGIKGQMQNIANENSQAKPSERSSNRDISLNLSRSQIANVDNEQQILSTGRLVYLSDLSKETANLISTEVTGKTNFENPLSDNIKQAEQFIKNNKLSPEQLKLAQDFISISKDQDKLNKINTRTKLSEADLLRRSGAVATIVLEEIQNSVDSDAAFATMFSQPTSNFKIDGLVGKFLNDSGLITDGNWRLSADGRSISLKGARQNKIDAFSNISNISINIIDKYNRNEIKKLTPIGVTTDAQTQKIRQPESDRLKSEIESIINPKK